jgi:hypothetical protein
MAGGRSAGVLTSTTTAVPGEVRAPEALQPPIQPIQPADPAAGRAAGRPADIEADTEAGRPVR